MKVFKVRTESTNYVMLTHSSRIRFLRFLKCYVKKRKKNAESVVRFHFSPL